MIGAAQSCSVSNANLNVLYVARSTESNWSSIELEMCALSASRILEFLPNLARATNSVGR